MSKSEYTIQIHKVNNRGETGQGKRGDMGPSDEGVTFSEAVNESHDTSSAEFPADASRKVYPTTKMGR